MRAGPLSASRAAQCSRTYSQSRDADFGRGDPARHFPGSVTRRIKLPIKARYSGEGSQSQCPARHFSSLTGRRSGPVGTPAQMPIEPRKRVLGSALGAGTGAAALLGSGLAHALTLEQAPRALGGAISSFKGVLAWGSLARVETSYGQKPRFPVAMTKLNGHSVVIEGHMTVLDDDDPWSVLLTAYQAHC